MYVKRSIHEHVYFYEAHLVYGVIDMITIAIDRNEYVNDTKCLMYICALMTTHMHQHRYICKFFFVALKLDTKQQHTHTHSNKTHSHDRLNAFYFMNCWKIKWQYAGAK